MSLAQAACLGGGITRTLSLWHLTIINHNNTTISTKEAIKYLSNLWILTSCVTAQV